jgi:hypothetical protein
MSESTLDIFEQKANEEQQQREGHNHPHTSTLEHLASSLELTVDYYIAEFM